MNYEINFLTISSPDYFCGSHNPVMTIPLWKNMTYSDLKEEILKNDEIWEYGDIEYPGKLIYNKQSFESSVDGFFEDINLNEIIPSSKMLDENEESLYAYFSIKQID